MMVYLEFYFNEGIDIHTENGVLMGVVEFQAVVYQRPDISVIARECSECA